MRRFQQVDVFGGTALGGNPLAVVLDSDGLGTDEMLRLTRWLNLSETTFLLPPTDPAADYRVRIFTPTGELPFAGHPTLGSAHAWVTAGGVPRRSEVVVQECGAGLVPVRRDGDRWAFAAPPLVRSGPVAPEFTAELATVLGVPPEEIVETRWIDNGPGWVGVLLADAAAVLGVAPDFGRYAGAGPLDIGVVGLYPAGAECAVEVRAFFSGESGELREDPVTGSLNASVAQWLIETGRLDPPYVASQGTRLGRTGRVHVTRDDTGTLWVGGAAVTHIRGELTI